jgi:hypothetical protein
VIPERHGERGKRFLLTVDDRPQFRQAGEMQYLVHKFVVVDNDHLAIARSDRLVQPNHERHDRTADVTESCSIDDETGRRRFLKTLDNPAAELIEVGPCRVDHRRQERDNRPVIIRFNLICCVV